MADINTRRIYRYIVICITNGFNMDLDYGWDNDLAMYLCTWMGMIMLWF